jgi:hypothetical protein
MRRHARDEHKAEYDANDFGLFLHRSPLIWCTNRNRSWGPVLHNASSTTTELQQQFSGEDQGLPIADTEVESKDRVDPASPLLCGRSSSSLHSSQTPASTSQTSLKSYNKRSPVTRDLASSPLRLMSNIDTQVLDRHQSSPIISMNVRMIASSWRQSAAEWCKDQHQIQLVRQLLSKGMFCGSRICADFARALGSSREVIAQAAKDGMPMQNVDAAREWLQTDHHLVKENLRLQRQDGSVIQQVTTPPMSPSSNLKMPIDDWTGDDVFEAPVDQSRDICSTQHPIDTLDGTVPVYVSSDCSSADDEACSHKDDDACYICVECKRMLHLSAFSPCQILLNLDQRKCQVCVAEDLSNQSDSMHENCTKSASDGEAAAAMNYQRDTRTADKQAAELHVDGDEQNQVPRECAEPASSAMLADEPDATHDQCADGAGFPPSHVFSAFQFVDAKNRSGCWHQACIVRCNISCIRVHFIGCSRDNDETIDRKSVV